MILSVSRRTDIPCYYSDWFYGRLKEGYALVRNPMNARQISRIDLSPGMVDCIVFWTKDPSNMMGRMGELDGVCYYFQFTITGYGRDLEPNLPDKREVADTFRRLSDLIGRKRVIWRYDPVILTDRHTPGWHLQAFGELAEVLRGYTDQVVISFLDLYRKTRRNLAGFNIREAGPEEQLDLAGRLAHTARKNGMSIVACAEPLDLSGAGVGRASCIDRRLIEELTGYPLKVPKDMGQRAGCGCVQSIDLGAYHTCGNGCRYCYANFSEEQVRRNVRLYDVGSPILCSAVGPEDWVTERKTGPLRSGRAYMEKRRTKEEE